jgi:nitrite reductase/ring-hydroxylating ferredoxin subunit
MSQEEELIKVCEVKDFLPGRKKLVELGNKDVSIFRLEHGEFYVI